MNTSKNQLLFSIESKIKELDSIAIKLASKIKLTQEERNKAILNAILDQVTDGYWDWDIKNDYEYLSPGFKMQLGFEDNELENHPSSWQKLIFEEDAPIMMDSFYKHVEFFWRNPYVCISTIQK